MFIFLPACTSGKGSENPDTAGSDEYRAVSDAVQAFVTANNTSAGIPLAVTGNPSTGYVLGSIGTTDLGMSFNNYFACRIDPSLLYEGQSRDEPKHSLKGIEDEAYDTDATTSGIWVGLKSFMLVGNGEEEKDDAYASLGYPFVDEFPFGSVYVMVASEGDAGDSACPVMSPVRSVSDYSRDYHSWFDAFARLTTQSPTDQLSLPGWTGYNPHEVEEVTESYWRNVAGPFQSRHFDDDEENPMKQEYGALAQVVSYDEPITVGVLSADFESANPVPCIRAYESDGAFLGATPFIQTLLPFEPIMESLASAGLEQGFTVMLAHHLNDSMSLFAGFCQAEIDAPLSELIAIPPLEPALIDVSDQLCDGTTEANLNRIELTVEGL